MVSFRFGGWVRVLNNHKFKRTLEEERCAIITHVSINKRFLEANGKKVPQKSVKNHQKIFINSGVHFLGFCLEKPVELRS